MSAPIAEPFAALGAGNGFPEHSAFRVCPLEFNVGASNVEDYVTLTEDQAMALAWNLASATGEAEAEYVVGGKTTTASITGTTPDLLQPEQRVCKDVQSQTRIIDFGENIPIPEVPELAQAIATVWANNLLTNFLRNASRLRIYTLGGNEIGFGFSDKIAEAEGFIREANEDFFEREYFAAHAMKVTSDIIQTIERVTVGGIQVLKVKERRDKDSSGSFAAGQINKLSASLTTVTRYIYPV